MSDKPFSPSFHPAQEVRDVEFSAEEYRRYARHMVLPEFGLAGQQKLKASRVLVVGAGGLGSPVLLYLAAAGVGTIGMVDFDLVDESNLQRQIIHTTADIGKRKVVSASETIASLNPNIKIIPFESKLTAKNALEVLGEFDVVVDGTDNFPTRYLLNDACVLLGIPNVYGSIFRFEGQASVFCVKEGPCYRCLYPEPPPPDVVPNCAEGGVLGVLPGIVGSIQATETIKFLTGIGETLAGRLLLIDALTMRFREMKLKKNPGCPLCGSRPTIRSLIDYYAFCGVKLKEPTNEDRVNEELTVRELKERLDQGEELFLLDVRETYEYELANLKGQLIPMRQLKTRLGELDPTKEIIVYCHVGGRSARAVEFLRQNGFSKARNLQGGIDAWSVEIDPSLPRY